VLVTCGDDAEKRMSESCGGLASGSVILSVADAHCRIFGVKLSDFI
jgi:hypothetical protein